MLTTSLLLLALSSSSAFTAESEEDEYETRLQVRKEEPIFDPSPNCEQTHKAVQRGFRKLLSKSPECKREILFLTFKRKELIRTQSLMIHAKAGRDGQKECESWLQAETKRLRSTFLYGYCRPPLPRAKPSKFASIGMIISLPAIETLAMEPFESFYSRQVKAEGDELVMQPTKKYLIGFQQFENAPPGKVIQDTLSRPVKKICEAWREVTLKKFSKDLSGIDACSGICFCRMGCACHSSSHMNFRNPVQGITLHKQSYAPTEEKAVADCQSWLKEMEDFNPAGYVTGRCSKAGFSHYAQDGGHIYYSKGASYQVQLPGGS